MRTAFQAALVATLAATAAALSAQSPQLVPVVSFEQAEPSDALVQDGHDLWFVELSGAPTSEGGRESSLEQEEAKFHQAAAAAGIRYTERRHFRKLWNGLTVRASAGEVARLAEVAGVIRVYPVVAVELSQDQSPDLPELVTALAQTGADRAQSSLGLSGKGVRVAVMDSGIDYHHPDLGGCFGAGCRVERGFDFVGDAFNADPASPSYNPVTTPDPDPDDCGGHGTHVAGIVGANGRLKGVAPGVTFHAYRVFGCAGSTSADIMLAAMERALDDDSDVLNMSIGSAFQWPDYPTAQGANRLVKRGVVVVASIGNSGATGLYSASAPGVGEEVIGVASFNNTHAALSFFTISPDATPIFYTNATAAPPAPLSGSAPMARTGTVTTTNDACNVLPAGSLAGSVALIRRGTCSFHVKAFNAQNAGALGVVLYNNNPPNTGRFSPTVAGPAPITIPVVAVSDAEGALINGRLAAGPVTMTWTPDAGSFPNPGANLISGFSSFGVAPDLSLKPDIGAPGGSVRSTVPLELGGYGPNSGTSMAAPHVAGAVALLLEARPKTKAKDVRHLLQNHADPKDLFLAPGSGLLDNVHRQGAGMLDIDDAILARAIVRPGKLSLGEIEAGSVNKKLKLKALKIADEDDDGGARVTYTLGHEPAIATGNGTFAPTFWIAPATVTFKRPTVTIGYGDDDDDDDEGDDDEGDGDDGDDAGGHTVEVTITPLPRDPNHAVNSPRLFGGYITLMPDDGGPTLRVPYAGYNGDYQEIPALVPTVNNFPWLARLVGATFFNQPGGATYTLAGVDLPAILLHLDHQVSRLTFDVIDVATGRSVGLALDQEFVGRNSSATSFFNVFWDGTTFKKAGGKTKAVPSGTYRIELSVLKANGDRKNPAHTERWSSPNIVIARP